ncbi:MAG: ECF transporter S component [Spirochaetota bacterium]
MQRISPVAVTLRASILERSPAVVASAVLVAVFLNGAFSWVNTELSIPLFLDAMFTCGVAAVFGPLAGGVTGILTNLFEEVMYGMPGTVWPFGIVNGAIGVIVGLLAAKGLFYSATHLVIAVLLLTLSSAMLGALIVGMLLGGASGAEVDYIAKGLMLADKPILWAVFLARIPANLVDKAISVVVGYMIYRAAFVHARD